MSSGYRGSLNLESHDEEEPTAASVNIKVWVTSLADPTLALSVAGDE